MSVTSQVAVLFIAVLVGALCRHLRYFTDETIAGVTNLVVNVSLPCLTVANLQRDFSSDVLAGVALTFVLSLFLIAAATMAGYFAFRNRPRGRRAVIACMLGFTNCGFMGYPIVLAVNPDLMIYAVAYNISYTLLCWTLGVSLFCGRENMSVKKALLQPSVIGSFVGLAFFCGNIRLPAFALSALDLIGSLTTPLSMLIIGTRVYGIRFDFVRDLDYHLIASLRLVALPLLTLALLRVLPLPSDVSSTLFLLTAMPAGSLIAMQAELFHGDSTFAARAIAYSTLLSLLTVPVMSMLI